MSLLTESEHIFSAEQYLHGIMLREETINEKKREINELIEQARKADDYEELVDVIEEYYYYGLPEINDQAKS